MPIRFTSPSLGGQRDIFLGDHKWQVGAFYRHLSADDWFIGSEVFPDSAPGGQPNRFNINTVDLTLLYSFTQRISLLFTLPLTTGTNSRIYADGIRHETSAGGIGDISLLGNFWLLDFGTHPNGNVAFGLGVKAPTGSYDTKDDFFGTPGGVIQFPVHPGLQPGDGGWGILVEAQGFQQLVGRLSGYINGAYVLNPKETIDIRFTPTLQAIRSVPDVYHLSFGAAYPVWPRAGISASLGIRVDGIPVHDVIGGSAGFRTPGYTTYLDPGVTFTTGPSSFSLNIPIRLHGEFKDNATGLPPAGNRGDLASYLIFFGYYHGF